MSRSRTAVIRSSAFLKHDTGDHPERASRIIAIDCELERRRLVSERPQIATSPSDDTRILRVHEAALLEQLATAAATDALWLDSDTIVRADSVDVARMAAGAATNAVDAILAGQIDRAFVAARPPGHHASASRAMGFCLLNTVAIAAAHAIAQGLDRVAILDWDVHHGNGTQDIFYGRSDVLFCSIHQSPFYPGTGARDETGIGDGEGYTVNLPLPAGTGDSAFLAVLRQWALPAIDRFAPQLLLISAGYDAHASDPIGGMSLTDDAFKSAMIDAIGLANRHCDGRVLAVLEGGYDANSLGRCVADAISLLDSEPAQQQ